MPFPRHLCLSKAQIRIDPFSLFFISCTISSYISFVPHQETLHDHKSRQRDKGKILNRNLDKKNNKWKSPGTGTRSTNVNADVDQNSPIGGFGDNDFPVNPLYHLSLHGKI